MARWDNTREQWRISASAYRPGEKRHRVVRSVKAPNTRAGRRQAEAAEIRLQARILDELEHEQPGGMVRGSFGQAATAWVDRHPEWSPKTIKETRYALRRYILPTLGLTRLDQVTPVQIEQLYAAWRAEGRAPSTMQRLHGMVRAVFRDALRLELIGRDPMMRVKAAGGRAPERLHMPAPTDVRRAIDAAASPTGALFFELAALTGARRGTIVATRWRDIDATATTVTYAHAITVGEDGPVLKGTKANRPYAVRLAGPVLERLRERRREASETAMALGLAGEFGELFVFSSDGGQTPWAVGYPSHAWKVACDRAGVKGCRLHDLRHFAASQMLAAGLRHRTVAERLGCTEANVIKTYSHWVPSTEDERAAEIMGSVLSG
jgi:integrase